MGAEIDIERLCEMLGIDHMRLSAAQRAMLCEQCRQQVERVREARVDVITPQQAFAISKWIHNEFDGRMPHDAVPPKGK